MRAMKWLYFWLMAVSCSVPLDGKLPGEEVLPGEETLPVVVIPPVEEPQPTVLTQQMVDTAQGTLVISRNLSLEGAEIVLPKDLTLEFQGGSLDGGTLVGNGTKLKVTQEKPLFGLSLRISGVWNVPEVFDWWFAFDAAEGAVSNQIIENALAFSNDNTFCHIWFVADRVYYFELPYKGRADLGNMVTYRMVDGKKRRNYYELGTDAFSFLRIFTIPSNTHLTVNNKLKMLPTSIGAYFVFWEYGKEKVTVDGSGVIAGDNDWHRYDSPMSGTKYYGEWGHLFKCARCKDFVFRDITLSDSYGDCIMFSGSHYPEEPDTRWASGLTVENVKILRARRNGMAIGARDVVIRNCHFEGCGTKEVRGTAPRSAIDFEPDYIRQYPEIGNEHVLLEKCTFKNNHFDVASYMNNMWGYGQVATVVKDCVFTSSLKIQGTFWMRFENCYIPFVWNSKDSERSVMLYSRHMEFVNCEFGEYDTSILGNVTYVSNKYKNCKFNTAVEH